MFLKIAVVSFVSLFGVALGLGQNKTITFAPQHGALELTESHGQILVDANDWWGVQKAAGDLAVDFGRVTGKNLSFWAANSKTDAPEYIWHAPTSDVTYAVGPAQTILGPTYTGSTHGNTLIIVGTIGHSSLIDNLVNAKKIDVSKIEGKWESFVSQVVSRPIAGVERALVIAGSDPRGAIFGIYDVSEQIGVSPWLFWADVPAQTHRSIFALNTVKVQGPPSVKYRGIFLNDEQPGLTNWVNNNYEKGKYGPGMNHLFYSTVFELLLRLRANYLWPTMWNGMFNVDDYENQPLSDAYAIVMGSSHTEPMMRASNEWGKFGKGAWRWDTNNASVAPFFKYGAQRAKPYVKNSLFTMAMRGSGDTAIPLTTEKAVQALVDAVAAQRQILTEVFADVNLTQHDIPQMWCLYKEVQGYYESGMSVPDDVTLLWADDNWGNVRRLPLASETSRSGGAGVYYHFDYVGDPRDYKWINTINLEKTLEQMKLAYARQADRIWIVNVGDLKGLELPINHFMDLAYNTPQWGYDSTSTWLKLWATREFGPKHAENIGLVMDKYGVLAARRKYELLHTSVYSVLNYHEAETALGEWESLAGEALAIYQDLPSSFQAAFFEVALHPILAGWTVYKIHIGAATNALYIEQRRNSANKVAQQVLSDFATDAAITKRFHTILGGKWKGIMDQTHLGYEFWQQPMRNAVPPLSYVQEDVESLAGNLGVGVESSNATVSGDDMWHPNSGNSLALPVLEPYGAKTRYIDIFSRGPGGCAWSIAAPAYLNLSQSSGYTGGHNGSDVQVYISVSNWDSIANTTTALLNFTSSCDWGNYQSPQIQVPLNKRVVPSSFKGFVESDAHLAFEAEHISRKTTKGDLKYITIPSYGRTLSGVTLVPVTADTQPAGSGPVLEYDFYSFTNTAYPANITLLLSPSLNQNGAARPLKYGIAVDNETPQIIQFVANATDGNLPTGWTGAVADAVWGLSSGNSTTTRHKFSPGAHTLKIWSVEPGVVFQKVIIDLGGVRPSYLGPPESFLAGVDSIGQYDGTSYLPKSA